MFTKRPINPQEIALIHHLLKLKEIDIAEFHIADQVEEYAGENVGSIGISATENAEYSHDLIQVEYIDTDGGEVVITLTQDTNYQLLDLDFWKVNGTKLIEYPDVNKVKVIGLV